MCYVIHHDFFFSFALSILPAPLLSLWTFSLHSTNSNFLSVCFTNQRNRLQANNWQFYIKKKLSSSSNVLIKIFGTSIGDCSGQLAVQIGMACTWPDWHKPIQQWRDKLGRRKRERRREVERGGSEMAAAAAVTVVGGPAIACRGCWKAIKASPAPCHPIRFLIEENRRKSKGTGWPGRHQRWWPKNR